MSPLAAGKGGGEPVSVVARVLWAMPRRLSRGPSSASPLPRHASPTLHALRAMHRLRTPRRWARVRPRPPPNRGRFFAAPVPPRKRSKTSRRPSHALLTPPLPTTTPAQPSPASSFPPSPQYTVLGGSPPTYSPPSLQGGYAPSPHAHAPPQPTFFVSGPGGGAYPVALHGA